MLNRNTIYKFINKNNKLNIMNYQPINCTLYDRIESLAVKKIIVNIIYLNESGIEDKEVGKIENIYSEAKSEFLLINEIKIRLDKIKVNFRTLGLFMNAELKNFFYPKSICVVGASSKEKSIGYEVSKVN